MPISRFVATILLMTAATIGWSQTSPEDHAAHHPPEKSPPATLAAESKDAMAPARSLIERAEHAATASERERLLDEHLAAMRKQLDALKSQEVAGSSNALATNRFRRPTTVNLDGRESASVTAAGKR